MRLAISLAVLAIPVAIYWFVIRPRLQARFIDTYAHLDGFWERVKARLWAFRTWLIGFAGIAASELPEVLSQLSLVDFSDLPTAWQTAIRIGTIVAMMWSRAIATTPNDNPEKS